MKRATGLLLVALLFVCLAADSMILADGREASVSWRSPVVVTRGLSYAVPAVAVEGDDVYVVWSTDGRLYFRRGRKGGTELGPRVQIHDLPYASIPSIVAVGPTVCVAWNEPRYPQLPDRLAWRCSNDRGGRWSRVREVPVTYVADPTVRLFGDQRRLYFAYADEGHLMLRTSTDRGRTWGDAVMVTTEAFSVGRADFLQAGRRLVAVYSGGSASGSAVKVRQSLDGGETWQRPTVLSKDARGAYPSIAGSGTDAVVAWRDFGTDAVVARRSLDGGRTWGGRVQLSREGVPAWPAWVARACGGYVAVWGAGYEDRARGMGVAGLPPGPRIVSFATSTDALHWSRPRPLTGPGQSPTGWLAVEGSGDRCYAAYHVLGSRRLVIRQGRSVDRPPRAAAVEARGAVSRR